MSIRKVAIGAIAICLLWLSQSLTQKATAQFGIQIGTPTYYGNTPVYRGGNYYNYNYSQPYRTYSTNPYNGNRYQSYRPNYNYQQPSYNYRQPNYGYGRSGYGYGYNYGYPTTSQQRGVIVGGTIGSAIGGNRGGNIGAAIGGAIRSR